MEPFRVDEEVFRIAEFRFGAGERALGIDQFRGAVRVATPLAIVAVLVRCMALGVGTGPLHKPIGQKRARHGIVKLGDFLLQHQSGFAERGPNLVANLPGLLAVGAAIVVEGDPERGEIVQVRLVHPGDQLLLGDALLVGTDHDRRAVGIVGANVDATIPTQLLEPDPNVGLQVLHQVAEMDWPIGIGQGTGDKDTSAGHGNLRTRQGKSTL